MIPKLIHLCWLSNDPYPPKIRKCLDSWKKYLPDYEIMLWNFDRFDRDESLWVRQAFDARKYAFAADYIRLYALYNYGGIYLDSDVEVLKSFDDLLELPYFVGAEQSGTIEAAIIGAEKGCDWIKCCLDYYEGRSFVLPDGRLDIRMLPDIMTETIQAFRPLCKLSAGTEISELKRTDMAGQVFVLPKDYFSPKVFDSRRVFLTPYTYAIHHYQNSWFSHKAFAYYRVRTIFIRLLGYHRVRSIEKFVFRK